MLTETQIGSNNLKTTAKIFSTANAKNSPATINKRMSFPGKFEYVEHFPGKFANAACMGFNVWIDVSAT